MLKSIPPQFYVEKNSFPIVAIGASAGGLEAFEQFFKTMPADSGMAFVVITHLDPHRKSLLPELLQHYTTMKVLQISNGRKLQPNVIHVIPPNNHLTFLHGLLQLLPQKEPGHIKLPIDAFFHLLAQEAGKQVTAIILSGAGTDGTQGLRSVKEQGGQVIAQTPHSAKFDSMPQSAINTGLVDSVLLPEQMPERLLHFLKQPLNKVETLPEPMACIFRSLLHHSGHDFSSYKKKTLDRRIQRRMAVHQIDTLAHYARYLQSNSQELDHLFKELLIGVTQFFRDPEAFASLKQQLLLKLHNGEFCEDNRLRIWVAGCSQGEEVYSLAIILQECIYESKQPLQIQIFGTDIDEAAIEVARTGIYPATIITQINAERLQQFFTKENDFYRINKNIREMIIFACQNIIRDPPFTKLDLLSCRNVLIYLDTSLQKTVLPLFYYSLKPNGLLFLGTSEAVSGFDDLFGVVDKKWKIFQRQKSVLARHPPVTFPIFNLKTTKVDVQMKDKKMLPKAFDISQFAEKLLLNDYAPPCVITNKTGDILYIHGKTGHYLEPTSGEVCFNVLTMVRPDLKTELVSVFHQAVLQNKTACLSNLFVNDNSSVYTLNLTVRCLVDEEVKGLMLVAFEAIVAVPVDTKKPQPTGKWAKQIAALERTLKETRDSLQIAIEEHKSSNEELQSINEELQSNNEEIETSKEELQSLNEELVTINSELQGRIDQLSSTNDDMKNLLDSTEIATLFLDDTLCIKRFTPKVTQLINLIPIDIGRPLKHFVLNLLYENLIEDACKVLKTLVPKSLEVTTKDGQWYSIRILPYRTTINVVNGVVVTFLNIHNQKQLELELKQSNMLLQEALDYSQSIIATMCEPFIVLDSQFKIVSANQAFYQMFRTEPAATERQLIYELGNQQWNIPKLKKLLEQIVPKNNFFNGFEVAHTFPTIGAKKMRLNARKVIHPNTKMSLILISIKDITDTPTAKTK